MCFQHRIIRVWGIVYLIPGFAEPPADKRKMLHTFFIYLPGAGSIRLFIRGMKRLSFVCLVISVLCSCRGNSNSGYYIPSPSSEWEAIEKGWTHLGTIATYSIGSDGMMHCCSDCARLDYQIINGVTRYRIYYPLDNSYYNVFENPEYGTSSRFRSFKYKAGHYYLNL